MVTRLLIRSTLFSCVVALAGACGNGEPVGQPIKKPSTKEYKEPMAEVNKRITGAESMQIDRYVERHGLTVTQTATGLRYVIYQKGKGNTPQPKSLQSVLIHFTAYLLNGQQVYTSRNGDPVVVTIDRDNVESGLHEGIKYMHVGDKAKFILPSHLAHGLTGDNNKIPPLTPVVYDIELLSIK